MFISQCKYFATNWYTEYYIDFTGSYLATVLHGCPVFGRVVVCNRGFPRRVNTGHHDVGAAHAGSLGETEAYPSMGGGGRGGLVDGDGEVVVG